MKCLGPEVGNFKEVAKSEECQEKCVNESKCSYYTYETAVKECKLYSFCEKEKSEVRNISVFSIHLHDNMTPIDHNRELFLEEKIVMWRMENFAIKGPKLLWMEYLKANQQLWKEAPITGQNLCVNVMSCARLNQSVICFKSTLWIKSAGFIVTKSMPRR